ncbi:MAG: hypothetical protein ABEL76_11350 [Bradymonadaceae bacterium]
MTLLRSPSTFAALGAATLSLIVAACGPPSSEAPNHPPSITSIGPVQGTEGGDVAIHYSLRDREGNEVDIEVKVGDGLGGGGVPAEGPGSDGTDFLPTVPAGENVPHVFVWDVDCGFETDDGDCRSLPDSGDDARRYTASISIEGRDRTVKTGSFAIGNIVGKSGTEGGTDG